MKKSRQRIVLWITYRGLKRLLAAAIILTLTAVTVAIVLTSNTAVNPWSLPLSGMVIAVDAGHGGPDGGAVSKSGVVEKDINLAIALHLRDYLQEAGALVVMTRETDKDLADEHSKRRKMVDLHRRALLVKSSDADLLISIHMNAIGSSRWRGAQTFYDVGAGEESKELARFIQEELIQNLENTDRVAKSTENVYLIRTAEIPAALVEAGFLSNPEEAALLADENYQKKVAAAIYMGILRYTSGEKMG